jgi:predicted RNA-binding protein associated with RNAse of E/G family
MTVSLLKGPTVKLQYPAVVLFDDGNHVVVRASWAEPASRDLGFVRLESGDVWTEHYWRDRWYSVKEIKGADGRLKGWYCDVVRPSYLDEGRLVSEDLELDLWVSADRQTIIRLDEEDFVSSGIAETDPGAATEARRAMSQLEQLARQGFAAISVKDLTPPHHKG